MSLENDIEFRKKLETSSNSYQILRNVMRKARALSTEYGDKILHSEAITHVINGTKPDIKNIMDIEEKYEADYFRELSCNMEDKEVYKAVYDSFYQSKAKKNLIFIYNNIKDLGKQSRVRVLTKMAWYKLILKQE